MPCMRQVVVHVYSGLQRAYGVKLFSNQIPCMIFLPLHIFLLLCVGQSHEIPPNVNRWDFKQVIEMWESSSTHTQHTLLKGWSCWFVALALCQLFDPPSVCLIEHAHYNLDSVPQGLPRIPSRAARSSNCTQVSVGKYISSPNYITAPPPIQNGFFAYTVQPHTHKNNAWSTLLPLPRPFRFLPSPDHC